MGWHELEDLTPIAHDREAIKARLAKALPNEKPGAIPVLAGQLYRFATEMKVGDAVVFRSHGDGLARIGTVQGTYKFDPIGDPEHPNRRAVKWDRSVPITSVSQGALYELGSAMTFFQVKNYADEWALLLAGSPAADTANESDSTVAIIAEATEQNVRDFIRKRLAKDQKGHPFAHFVAHLLGTMGYRTRVAPEGADGGVDIVAHRDELGFEPPIIKVQVKSSEGNVGGPAVAELIGNLGAGEFGLFVTLGNFTPQAKQKATSNIRLINGEELIDLVLDHYEQLDSHFKGVVPLRRTWAPEPVKED